MRSRFIAGLAVIGAACSCDAAADRPSFPCTSVEPNSVEHMICNDAGLSALDRKLAEVYDEMRPCGSTRAKR
jgi:uncharacterized protein